MMERKLRVAVVFGGRSNEHAISCVSAGSVLTHLDRTRFEVIPVGIGVDGAWVLGTGEPADLAILDRTLPVVDGAAAALTLPGDPTRQELVRIAGDRPGWCSPEWTWCSRCCTVLSARTARSRVCWSWPTCLMSGRGY
jgi:D-alanine-D-alanine ligase